MGPTVKAGVRTGFTVPDGSEKTGHKTRQKAKTEKANNHKAQTRHCEQAQLSRRIVMAYASQQSHPYGVKYFKKMEIYKRNEM